MPWFAASVVFSALSAACFLRAMFLGLRLSDPGPERARKQSESRAAVAAALALVLLLAAAVCWGGYLAFGPLQDLVEQVGE